MQGGIYSEEVCRICGNKLIDNHRNAVACPVHTGQRARRLYVKFGRKHKKRFTSYQLAMKHLNYLRYEKDDRQELFDIADYGMDRPKSFRALTPQYLAEKREKGRKSMRKIEYFIEMAATHFGNTNLRDIDDVALDAYLRGVPGGLKTRRNHQIQLHNFWMWALKKRKALTLAEMPSFDPIEYKLGYRKITTWEIQRQVLNKIKEMTYSENPRIWLAIDLLATYTELRPDDIRRIREGDYRNGFVTIFDPTKSENKNQPWITIKLIDEHMDEWDRIRSEHSGIPTMPFFRHHKGRCLAKPGDVFGKYYLARIWKRAAEEVGLKGVTLYPGTRHTTVTETARAFGSDDAKKASGHRTNKAFDRYNQAINDGAYQVVSKIRSKMTGKVVPLRKGGHRGDTETGGPSNGNT